jgi:hypothetical protein
MENVGKSVAEQIADIIRVSGIEVFRQAVRQVACDRLKTEDERERREEARLEALKKDGVLYLDGSIPDRPDGDWYFHQDVLGGYIKLPSKVKLPQKQPKRPKPPACLRDRKPRKEWNNADKKAIDTFHAEEAKYYKRIEALWPKWHRFKEVKQRGFPNDDDGDYPYEFDLCCWLPRELHPTKDPRNKELLPVPWGPLTNVEKIAVLAALYDAYSRGSEKVAPWGLSDDGSDLEAWQANGAERDEKRAALDYSLLFQKAQRLDHSDLTIVESWLKELSIAVKKAESQYLGIKLGDREALRIVNGKTLTAKFGSKGKPWEMFRELYHGGETGLAKGEIMTRLWPKTTISDNNLDQHKATANVLLMTIRVEIKPDNHGVWRLDELNS